MRLRWSSWPAWTVVATACLESVWTGILSRNARRSFFVLFAGVTGIWLCVMSYGCYIWSLNLPYYRTLGVITGFCHHWSRVSCVVGDRRQAIPGGD